MLRILLIISLFAIAMGFLESAVVIYLRAIYYPEGFDFPLKIIEGPIAVTEIIREAATIIMLGTVSFLVTRRWIIRFAWFIYMFAIWDIFYYLFLWALLGWPESLLTWDILFLIPTTWVGPVLAPLINSITMILLAVVIIQAGQTRDRVRLSTLEWGFLITGSLITILAYILDYSRHMLDKFSFSEWLYFSNHSEVMDHVTEYIPRSFDWWLFLLGELLFIIAITFFIYRNRKKMERG